MTAEEIWLKQKIKNECATKKGFDVVEIWEKDYNSDKNLIIEKCLEIIKNKKQYTNNI